MTSAPPGWYPQPDGRHRYWDGSAWTEQLMPASDGGAPSVQVARSEHGSTPRVSREQIAHDLAIAYINNRYGAEVRGEFSVTADQDWTGSSPRVSDVKGSGEVWTETLPRVMKMRMDEVVVKTGRRTLFGLGPERTRTDQVESGEFEVDPIFRSMIRDYYDTYDRFMEHLVR